MIVQCARTIGPGFGVAGPSWQLERAFQSLGQECRRFTLADLGYHPPDPPPRHPWLALLIFWWEIFLFSTLGTLLLAWRYRRRSPETVVVCQVDALYGDIFVVRSLHKAFLQRRPDRHWMLLRNPLHAFVLARDWLRFKTSIHRHFVTLSENNKAELIELYQVPPQKISVIPNGVDLQRFRPCPQRRRAIRQQFPLAPQHPVVLFVGHEFERKGLQVLLQGLRLLLQQGLEVSLWVIGGDDPRPYQRAYPDLQTVVHYLGHRQDIEDFYSAADLFCMPAHHDISPLVGPEALASGLPILIPRLGGVVNYLRHGENGYFIAPEGQDIADKIGQLLRDTQLRQRMAQAARHSVQELDWSRLARQYLELFERLERGWMDSRDSPQGRRKPGDVFGETV